VARQGSDFSTIFIRLTENPLSRVNKTSGTEDGRLKDEIHYVKFSSITWTRDSKGFFYQVIRKSAFDHFMLMQFFFLNIALSRQRRTSQWH
jgi:dTDP-4-dehydrorhamnose 3,5-epimerase-like enzyme